MRHLRLTFLAAVAIALSAAPVAGADGHPRHDRHPLIEPASGGGLTGGQLAAQFWGRYLALPAGTDPFVGGCAPIAHDVVTPDRGPDDTGTCAITRRTRVFVYYGTQCANVDGGGETRAQQLTCAVDNDRAVEAITITVDARRPINIVRPRFEVSSPQTTVQLPPGNVFDVPAGPATFTAHGWAAVVRKLRPGRHTLRIEIRAFGDTSVRNFVLNVARSHRPDDDDDRDDED
jgi:hypothetical protein